MRQCRIKWKSHRRRIDSIFVLLSLLSLFCLFHSPLNVLNLKFIIPFCFAHRERKSIIFGMRLDICAVTRIIFRISTRTKWSTVWLPTLIITFQLERTTLLGTRYQQTFISKQREVRMRVMDSQTTIVTMQVFQRRRRHQFSNFILCYMFSSSFCPVLYIPMHTTTIDSEPSFESYFDSV